MFLQVYQRYKEIWLLFFGFLLTSVFGASITYYYQELSNQRKDKELSVAAAKAKGEETIKLISDNISRRHYSTYRYIYALKGKNGAGADEGKFDQTEREYYNKTGVDGEKFDQIEKEYYESIESWNSSWNLMRVSIKRAFCEEMEKEFCDFKVDSFDQQNDSTSITGKFRRLHSYIDQSQRKGNNANKLLDSALQLYNSLASHIYGFYDNMMADVQSGNLGENRK